MGQVREIRRDGATAQIKFAIPAESTTGSVITVDSRDEMDLKVGDEALLFLKAVKVLPFKAA